MPFPIVILQTVKQLDQLLPEDFGGLAELRKINAENVVVLVQIRTDPFFTFSYVRALIGKLPILGYPLLDGRQSAPV